MNSSIKISLTVTAIVAVIILITVFLTSPDSQPVVQAPAPVDQSPAVTTGASLTIVDPISGTVNVGVPQHIKWVSQNYPSPTVAINLLKQESSNPISYKLIRTIAPFTQNDGDAVWVPSSAEVGQDIVIEVACTVTDVSCASARSTNPIAVVNGGQTSKNTASVYSALEQSQNK